MNCQEQISQLCENQSNHSNDYFFKAALHKWRVFVWLHPEDLWEPKARKQCLKNVYYFSQKENRQKSFVFLNY